MLRILNSLATALTVIGAINWGLVGLFRFNLVKRIAGASTRAETAIYVAVGLAGSWLGITLTLPRVLIALGVRGMKPPAMGKSQSIVGRVMPTVKGTTLSGKEVTLPENAQGKIAFLVMGFAYDARFDVEDWLRAFRERFGQNPDVVFFEMPMIGGVYRLFAPMIDAGMRRATPPEMLDNVVTVYASQGPLREALGAAPTSDTWVYLLDRDGRVLFQYGGPFDQQKLDELASLLESAVAKGRARGRKAA